MKRSELTVFVVAVHSLPRRGHAIDAHERVAHRKAARDVFGAIDLAARRAVQGGAFAAHGAQVRGHHLGRGSVVRGVIRCVHTTTIPCSRITEAGICLRGGTPPSAAARFKAAGNSGGIAEVKGLIQGLRLDRAMPGPALDSTQERGTRAQIHENTPYLADRSRSRKGRSMSGSGSTRSAVGVRPPNKVFGASSSALHVFMILRGQVAGDQPSGAPHETDTALKIGSPRSSHHRRSHTSPAAP